MKTPVRLLYLLVVATFALGACNMPDAEAAGSAANTAAAQTIQAQLLTLTASAPLFPTVTSGLPVTSTIPATLTPPPTLTQPVSPTPICDLGKFVNDVTIPDGTIMTPGQTFTKTWKLQNVGTCTWSGYSLVFDTGDSMNGAASSAISTTAPNGFVEVSVNLTAPASAGNYRGYWRIRNASGTLIPIQGGDQGTRFYVDIKVQVPVTATTLFAVTSVTFSLSTWSSAGFVNCPRVTANITVSTAGTVTYKWTRSDGSSAPTNSLTFASAGTQSVNYDWSLGSTWAGTPHWVGIYIDTPNHQDMGHLEFTTACTSP